MADAALDAEAKEKLAEQMQKVQDGIEASNGTILLESSSHYSKVYLHNYYISCQLTSDLLYRGTSLMRNTSFLGP